MMKAPVILKSFAISFVLILFLSGCDMHSEDSEARAGKPDFYLGADLSYVNEMQDCGAVYRDSEGNTVDPYEFFSTSGANLVRLRLWHSPSWTSYSNFADVKQGIQRAKAKGMHVLLDFHYSDTWADPAHQLIPSAWADAAENLEVLADSVYNYTYQTLNDLATEGLLPDIVQVGNEINIMILQNEPMQSEIDWNRNAVLLNSGIQAVRSIEEDHETTIEVMLHIAQPENALWWFPLAISNGIQDFEWIGLSYYPKWSEYQPSDLSNVLNELIVTHQKRLMIVETAYPFTMENADSANNVLGEDSLIPGYPATQSGQAEYLSDLYYAVKQSGGEGVIYWEPAWVSTSCNTLWGQGSHWDNAVLFDHEGLPTQAFNFYQLGE